jgi:hypothetical protein
MPFLPVHRRMAALLGALSAPLLAQPVAPGPSSSPERSLSTLTVVELPPEGGIANARRHHAVSIPFHAASQTARRLGIDTKECALQLRVPTRVAHDPVAGARATVEIQAQVRLACRM